MVLCFVIFVVVCLYGCVCNQFIVVFIIYLVLLLFMFMFFIVFVIFISTSGM